MKNILLGSLLIFFIVVQPVCAQNFPRNGNVKVSAFVPAYEFTLYGFTSPQAVVSFDGVGIHDTTIANKSGYFIFENRFSPSSPREPCLTAKDQLGRVSSPACLPPFPTEPSVIIGPVLLPPTLSTNRPSYFTGDEVSLSGQTTPDTDVTVSLFVDEAQTRSLSFVQPVSALAIPRIPIHSDNKGNFVISVPSAQKDAFRVFAQSQIKKEFSARSNTLQLQILPWWMSLLPQLFLVLLGLFGVFLLGYLSRQHLLPHRISRTRALTVRGSFALVEPSMEEELLKLERELSVSKN